jgi:tetratricopeptide (TPR) repeat protein
MILNRQRKWARGIEALDRAACCDPENRVYVNTLGYTLARAGRFEEAFHCFARVTTEARAHYKLARMQEHLGQKNLARQQLRLAVKKEPRLQEARAMLQWLESPQPAVRRVGHAEPGPRRGGPAPRR